MDIVKVTYHTIDAEGKQRKHVQVFTILFCARRFANTMHFFRWTPVSITFDADIDANMTSHGNGHYSMVIPGQAQPLRIMWADVEEQIEQQIQELLALSLNSRYMEKAVQIQQLLAVRMGQQQEVHLLAEAEREERAP